MFSFILRSLFRTSLFRPVFAFVLMATSVKGEPVTVWTEGETFSEVSGNAATAISQKAPASGGRSTAGSALIKAGSVIRYELDLVETIPDAKIVVRYARLHFRESMEAAQLRVKISSSESTAFAELVCGNTEGWGTRKANEWHYVSAHLNSELKPGKLSVEFAVDADGSNVNLDGFYLASEDFLLSLDETRELQRIRFLDSGYVGLRIAGDTVFPGVFDGFQVVGRGYVDGAMDVRLTLIDGSGVSADLGKMKMKMNSKPAVVNFGENVFDQFSDGAYTLRIENLEHAIDLRHPISIMRELVEHSRSKVSEYQEVLQDFRGGGSWRSGILEPQWRLIPDLEHAIEYIENTILVLEARQRGDSTSTERQAALAYFENSRARTAADFANDLRTIIAQTDASLAQAGKGLPAYEGRFGDLRRAFYSTATGALEPYRIYVPKASAGMDSVPLILMLHGGGGDENYFPDLDGGDVLAVLEERPAIMLSPRCTSWYWGPGASDLKQLIDATVMAYPNIDTQRIYCTGVSAGGGGTFRLAQTFPGLFRAIAPVSSGPQITDEAVERLGGVPMLIIQGGQDVVAAPERAIKADRELTERNYPHEFLLFPDYGHEYHGREYLEHSLDYFEEVD